MFKNNINTSVIIPTKNRPSDLMHVLESIFCQTVIPGELIIVDQSETTDSKKFSLSIFNDFNYTNFKYIYDTSISGLVEAKKIGVSTANGDLIFFLEDDVVLDTKYMEEIILGFHQNSKMIGCSGVINNHPLKNKLHSILFAIFHIGIFKDIRFRVFAQSRASQDRKSLIESDKLSGGVSAWKHEVFSHIYFDLKNDFHMLEDIDFSTRVAMKFGGRLFINPNAKLDHNFAPSGRASIYSQRRRKTRECIVYYKKRAECKTAFLSICVLMFGMFLDSFFQSISLKSFAPLKGWIMGLIDGVFYELVF